MKSMNRPFGGLHTTMRSAGARSGASWKRTCTRKKSLSTSGNQWFREVRVQVGAVSLTQAYARIYAHAYARMNPRWGDMHPLAPSLRENLIFSLVDSGCKLILHLHPILHPNRREARPHG
jgi:hypothetical protein